MRSLLKVAALFALLTAVFFSCKKDAKETPLPQEAISQQVLDKIYELGFGNKNVARHPEGYLVEGDIVITEEDLRSSPDRKLIRVGDEEQYRTTNTVTGLPRNITVRLNSSLPARYTTALNSAISRYNALGLRITFSRVTSGGNIVINPAPSGAGYLASAGFPSSSGNPYGSVLVNRSYLDTWNINTVTSIIAHEIGHCIGYRHTDYANRAYSCGGSAVNEGQAGVGAIHIPGTPTTNAVSGSWMLACIGNGVNRPFISSDITALNYVY
ncbi:protease [Pseudoflavitalea sp. X16]|uniref:M57 family metalloprotease n=1 Tax=Paraflavitalea devenefica TaxID=2716334 RepID=UPI00141F9A3C|nr:M57 family metalloprotease [Paraflavitalea devenefica]NII25575.1 protease [Paraflavitalea devenefica]